MTDTERIKALEVRTKDHERRLRIQETNSENLAKIATYVELQTKHNEKQDRQLDNITQVMNEIHVNLAGLNKDVSSVKEDMGNVVVRVDGLEKEHYSGLKDFKKTSIDSYLKVALGILIPLILGWLALK